MSNSEKWITHTEAAEHLGVPAAWLYACATTHGIPRVKLGRQWRYSIASLDRYMQDRMTTRPGA